VIYRIDVAPAAERQLRRLDATVRMRIGTRIRSLAEDPRPHGASSLAPAKVSGGFELAPTAWSIRSRTTGSSSSFFASATAAMCIGSWTACESADCQDATGARPRRGRVPLMWAGGPAPQTSVRLSGGAYGQAPCHHGNSPCRHGATSSRFAGWRHRQDTHGSRTIHAAKSGLTAT
jgi:hypothetical protein